MSKILALNVTFLDSFPEISKSKAELVTAFWLFPEVTPLDIKPFVCKPLNSFVSDAFLLVVKLYKTPLLELFLMMSFSSKGV